MDHKKRLQVVCIISLLTTLGIWQFGPEDWQKSALPISFRITIFFGILLLAFNDVKDILLMLKGPIGILIGIGLIMAVIFKPSTKVILPLLVGCVIVLAILGFIRRQFGKGD